jgi:hypothetical protein
MHGRLRAKLVIIAPSGSIPADFARQRRFTYFASLENYATSLRDVGGASGADRASAGSVGGNGSPLARRQEEPKGSRGRWPFGRRQELPLGGPPEPPVPLPLAGGTGEPQAEDANAGPGPDKEPLEMEQGHGVDAAGQHSEAAQTPDSAQPSQAVPAPHAGGQDEPGGTDAMDSPPPAKQGPDAQSQPGGAIITFPARKRDAVDQSAADDTPTLVPGGGLWRRNSAKGASPAAQARRQGAALAGSGAVAARARVTAKLPIAGGSPPGARSVAAGRGGGGRGRWGLLLLLLLAFLVLFATVAYAAPGALPTPVHNFFNSFANGGTPAATIVITPRSSDELDTYVLTGVTSGTPDRSKRQVQVRQLTSTPPSQSKSATATGLVNTPAVQATGSLTFYNGSAFAYSVKAQTVFTDASGVSVENNSPVVIPAGSPAVGYGHTTVTATATVAGSRGNIRAGDFSLMQCCGSGSMFVSNGAFGGGQDPQHYTAVQQSDIDGAANPLKQPLLQKALADLNAMKRPNEQFVSRPACTPKVISDQPVGSRARSVRATVSATCTGEVYDQSAAAAIASDLLKARAMHDLGPNYVLVGNVVTSLVRTQTDPQGELILFERAEGTWAYQITDKQKALLVQHIKGMSTKEALAYLQSQPGVGQVRIILSGNNTPRLPADANAISITVNVPGGQVPATPTSGPGVGLTPTNNPGGSGITPPPSPLTPGPSLPPTPFPSPSVGGS